MGWLINHGDDDEITAMRDGMVGFLGRTKSALAFLNGVGVRFVRCACGMDRMYGYKMR
jgi:hypothetical protein